MHGKMGISLFLYRCARATGNDNYAKYADELLDEIFEKIFSNISLDFESGLCGIGYGIDYLIKNKYVDTGSENVLREVDKHIELAIEDENADEHLFASVAKYWLQRKDRKAFNIVVSSLSRLLLDKINTIPLAYKSWFEYEEYFEIVKELLMFDVATSALDKADIQQLFDNFIKANDYLYQTCTRWSGQYVLEKICQHFGQTLPELIPPKVFHLHPLLPPATDIRLADLLAFKDYNLQYGFEIPAEADSKIETIVNDTALTYEWIRLVLPQTMGISGNMTGFGWILLSFL